MKRISVIIIMLCFAFTSYSQNTEAEGKLRKVEIDTNLGWKKGGILNVGLTQTSLTNWAAGGNSSVGLNGLLNY